MDRRNWPTYHRHSPGIAYEAITRSSTLIGEALERVYLIIAGLRLNPQRMRSNLDLSGGVIGTEAIMLELGKTIGRQHAHDVVYEAAQAAANCRRMVAETYATLGYIPKHSLTN